MTEVIIRHRLVTWFEEFEDRFAPNGTNLRERISHKGEEVDIPDEEITRIEGVNSPNDPPFYTPDQADAIRLGSYRGHDSEVLYSMRAGQRPKSAIESIDGEGPQVATLETDELAEYIKENRLTVAQYVELIPKDADLETLEKFMDAENIATDNSPRAGVEKEIDARMQALNS